MRSYLGTTGAAIPIDLLKVEHGCGVYVRFPRQDARPLRAGVSSWVGSCEGEDVPGCEGMGRVKVAWRVKGESAVLGGIVGGDGMEMFGEVDG